MSRSDDQNKNIGSGNFKYGLAEPKFRFIRLFFGFLGLPIAEIVKNYGNMIEQSVSGYDPHVVAWRWPWHAAIFYDSARGSILNRDVLLRTEIRI